MKLHPWSAALASATLALTITLTGCSSDSTNETSTSKSTSKSTSTTVETPDSSVIVEQPLGPQRVDATRFADVVATPGVQIIDVRSPEEFAEGHIAGAVNLNVQGPDFDTQIAGLDPMGTYAVYCRSGNRSVAAVERMSAQGINSIFELESGITGWEKAGLPVVL